MLKRILITGVDGFIGSWLARTLRENGAEVFGLSRRSQGNTDGVVRFRGEITNQAEVEAAIRECRPDGIFHLAAKIVVTHLAARRADDGELLRQEPAEGERVQRREQLPLRQVAGGAEDDEDARIRRAPKLQSFEQRVLLRCRH